MSATIFQGDKVTAQKDAISLNGGPEFRTVASDPQLVAVDCPEGSIVEYNGQLYRKTDNGSCTNVVILGTGAGGAGGVNFIENADAELNNTTGWATYADAAGTRPVDGTGGSANITFTNTTSTPLAGSRSFLFTKDAANRQGQGVAYTFDVDPAYRAKAISVSFDYIVASGTFAAGSRTTDSDIIVYLYDVTNSLLIEPSNIKLFSNSSTVSDKFEAQFQTSATGASYRIILHCASTSASAYAVEIDNISVGPSEYVFGTPVTDWTAYTITTSTGTKGTTTIDAAYWRRVGDSVEIRWDYQQTVAGSNGSGTYELNLPTGLTIDSAKVATSGVTAIGAVGECYVLSGSTIYSGITAVASSTKLYMIVSNEATAHASVGSSLAGFGTTVTRYSVTAKVPIVGWSSSVQTSDAADTRVVACYAHRNGTDQTGVNPNASTVQILMTSVASSNGAGFDTHGAFNTASSYFEAPTAGFYEVDFTAYFDVTNVLANTYFALVTRGTSTYGASTEALRGQVVRISDAGVLLGLSCVGTLQLNAGDRLFTAITGAGNNSVSTLTMLGTIARSRFIVKKVQGPSAIAASETVAVTANRVGAQAIASTAATQVAFNSAEVDTHGILNTSTGTITIPAAGLYLISSNIVITSLTAAEAVEALISRSVGLPIVLGDESNYDNSTTRVFGVVGKVARMTAGETIVLTVDSVADSSYNVTTGSFISVVRIGL